MAYKLCNKGDLKARDTSYATRFTKLPYCNYCLTYITHLNSVFPHTLCQDAYTSWVKFDLIYSVFRMCKIVAYDTINYIKYLITLHLNSSDHL